MLQYPRPPPRIATYYPTPTCVHGILVTIITMPPTTQHHHDNKAAASCPHIVRVFSPSRHRQPSAAMAVAPRDKLSNVARLHLVIARQQQRAPRSRTLQRRLGYTPLHLMAVSRIHPIMAAPHAPLRLPRRAPMRPRPTTSASSTQLLPLCLSAAIWGRRHAP